MLHQVEIKLKYYSQIMFEVNVPVGFIVTDSGKFAIRFSHSSNIKSFDKIEDFFHFILNYNNENT